MASSPLIARIIASLKQIWARPSAYQDRRTCIDIDRVLGPVPPADPAADRPPVS